MRGSTFPLLHRKQSIDTSAASHPCSSPVYDARFWNPPKAEAYTFKNKKPAKPKAVKIYEAHGLFNRPKWLPTLS